MLDSMKDKRNKIVARFEDGKILKGYTHDFSPVKETFHLKSEMEEDKDTLYEVKLADLKAVFFVKSLEGNKDYVEKKMFYEIDASSLKGLKIKIEFSDGEIMSGVTLSYSKGRKGFFLIPVDAESNNVRVFVVSNSLSDVKVGSAAEK